MNKLYNRECRINIWVILLSFLTLVSCSDLKKDSNVSMPEHITETNYSASELITEKVDIDTIKDLRYCTEEKRYYMCMRASDVNSGSVTLLHSCDEYFENDEILDMGLEKNERIVKWDVDENGNVAAIILKSSERENEINPDEPIKEKKYFVVYYDSESKSHNTRDIVKLEDKNVIATDLFLLNDIIVLSLYDCELGANELYTIGKSGEEKSLLKFDDSQQIESITKNESGFSIIYSCDEKVYFCKFDVNSLNLNNSVEIPYRNDSVQLIQKYKDGEEFFITSKYLLSKNENDEFEIICDLDTIGSEGGRILSAVMLPDESFTILEQDATTDNHYIIKLSENSEMTDQSKKEITLGVGWLDDSVKSKITRYNRFNKEYKVTIKDYSVFDNTDGLNTASDQLALDFVKGKAPDAILYTSFENGRKLEELDAFADLYEFIDVDDGLNRSDFFESVLENYENHGKLFSMPVNFYIQTLAGLTDSIGEKNNWDYYELMEKYEESSGTMKLLPVNTRENILDRLFYPGLNAYVDYDDNKCTLNSDEIFDFLEFTRGFETEDNTDGSLFDIPEKKALLADISVYNFDEFHEILSGYFGNNKITFVGFPCSDDTGLTVQSDLQFSINDKSTNKLAAWNFIRDFYMYDYQTELQDAFPINEKAFDYLAQKSCCAKTDESGEIQKNIVDLGKGSIDIGYMSAEEVEILKKMISDMGCIPIYDSTIYKICEDEFAPFLNDDQSTQETVERIKRRIEIYLNEKK